MISERVAIHTIWAGVIMTLASLLALCVLCIAPVRNIPSEIVTAVLAFSGPATATAGVTSQALRKRINQTSEQDS